MWPQYDLQVRRLITSLPPNLRAPRSPPAQPCPCSRRTQLLSYVRMSPLCSLLHLQQVQSISGFHDVASFKDSKPVTNQEENAPLLGFVWLFRFPASLAGLSHRWSKFSLCPIRWSAINLSHSWCCSLIPRWKGCLPDFSALRLPFPSIISGHL